MKGLIVAVAALLMAPMGTAAAQQATPPLNAEAARSLSDFQNFGPHRAFVIGGAGGADPGNPVAIPLKRCEERASCPAPCTSSTTTPSPVRTGARRSRRVRP